MATCQMSGSVCRDVKKLKVFRQSRSFDAGSNPRSGQKLEKEESGPSAVLPLHADCANPDLPPRVLVCTHLLVAPAFGDHL